MEINFDKFKNATGYDIQKFFEDFVSFVSSQYQFIVDYYDGGDINNDAFFELERLTKEAETIEPLFELNKGRLNTVDMWDLLDKFDDTQNKLLTINRLGKWMRSSRLGVQNQDVKIDRILRQNENFEDVANDIGYSDPQNSWFDIALSNLAIEEDYTPEGGLLFTISLQNNFNFDLPNIVDYFSANNIYGKDIAKSIVFENNDLKTVSGDNNLKQNFGIKLSIQKRTVPEFPEDGINSNLIGSNQAAFQYPTIIRDVVALFKKDARWSEVNIIDIVREEDAIFLRVEAKTILKNSFITNISI